MRIFILIALFLQGCGRTENCKDCNTLAPEQSSLLGSACVSESAFGRVELRTASHIENHLGKWVIPENEGCQSIEASELALILDTLQSGLSRHRYLAGNSWHKPQTLNVWFAKDSSSLKTNPGDLIYASCQDTIIIFEDRSDIWKNRWALLHELSHHLAPGDFCHSPKSPVSRGIEEGRADLMAYFLMPRTRVNNTITDLGCFGQLHNPANAKMFHQNHISLGNGEENCRLANPRMDTRVRLKFASFLFNIDELAGSQQDLKTNKIYRQLLEWNSNPKWTWHAHFKDIIASLKSAFLKKGELLLKARAICEDTWTEYQSVCRLLFPK